MLNFFVFVLFVCSHPIIKKQSQVITVTFSGSNMCPSTPTTHIFMGGRVATLELTWSFSMLHWFYMVLLTRSQHKWRIRHFGVPKTSFKHFEFKQLAPPRSPVIWDVHSCHAYCPHKNFHFHGASKLLPFLDHRATTMLTKSYQHGIQCTMFQQKNIQNSLSSYFSDVFGFRDNNALTTLGVGDGRWDVHIHFDTKHLTGVTLLNTNLDMNFLLTPGFLSGLDFFSDKLIFGGVTCSSTSKGVAIWQLFWGPADSALAKMFPWPSLDVQDVIHLHSMFFVFRI